MIKPVEIVVGRGGPYDPIAGTTDCPMTAFAGQQLWIDKTGYGPYDYDKYQELPAGGFRLIGGAIFAANERFYVHFTGLSYGTGQTNYTNGFNFSRVISALFGRVGWRQPIKANSPVISGPNLVTKGGRYYQDFHSLVTIDNIKQVIEEVAATDSALNSYLESIQRGIIMQCVNNVFKAPEAITKGILFSSTWNNNDTLVENTGKFVGIMFRTPPMSAKGEIAVQIDSVALYFDSDVTFNLYVYNDRVKAPLAVIEVTAVAKSQTLVDLSDIILNYIGPNSLGGTFYIGYYQDDIGAAKAYYENMTDPRCDLYAWSFMNADKIAGQYDFDRRHTRVTNVNYGLNAHVTTFYDHTSEIVKRAPLFDNAIGLQMAVQMVEKIFYSTRSNGTERILKDMTLQVMAQLDLNGVIETSEGPKFKGNSLKQQVQREFDNIRKSFNKCQRSQTITYGDFY